ENHDGHDHVVQAVQRGAVAAVVEVPLPGPVILVADTVRALGDLATAVLRRATAITVVGITGSSGKTSTKDLLAAVLAADGSTVAPIGSFNNEIGLPMTVLSIDRGTKYLVLEMGARGPGHVAALCSIARPDVGIVLNVGSAHLGEFGSPEATAAAKAELVQALDQRGTAVLNADDARVAQMASLTQARVVTFGVAPDAMVRLERVDLDDSGRPRIRVRTAGSGTVDIQLSVHGAHQAMNVAAVMAAATCCGVAMDTVVAAVATARIASRWRMETTVTADGSVVINDAYNANPESMAAALRALMAMGRGRTTWAVLGEMRELGDGSEAAHAQVGALAAQLGIARLVAVGPRAGAVVSGALAAGFSAEEARQVTDIAEARALLAQLLVPGDVVLVKASRAIGLEVLADGLISDHGGDAVTGT
ncbi:MAG: UDP-N-acetylmuramoyl-tripeptide--D-alanyl-D-alanine ligase, partial [Actinomycetes bacterium]